MNFFIHVFGDVQEHNNTLLNILKTKKSKVRMLLLIIVINY